ncbi:MAG: type II toxin-antitoxin system Phd/YefM family antitoxin [Candidatus Chisholmbacteria bacterium]|nr:type II toxin-antitoxin system Phd/YefM family antitoxin [Candidatus Chisholmbacteria bacterium]
MILPKTVSARDIQRDYRRVFNEAKASKKPVVVLTNNKPDVVIMDVKEMEKLYERAQKAELEEALAAVVAYKREKSVGKLRRLNSLRDLK